MHGTHRKTFTAFLRGIHEIGAVMGAEFEFSRGALPWIAMGLLLAVCFVRKASRQRDYDKHETFGSVGMAIAIRLFFGVAISMALQITFGLGLMAGMVVGYVIGSQREINRED